jgi:hypothetical protein
MWPKIEFIPYEVSQARENQPSWDARFESESRWIGQLGEEAFRRWCLQEGVEYTDFTHDGPCWVDFEALGKKIDVKTIGTKWYPKKHYACNVDSDQNVANVDADTYVFVRFIHEKNYALLVGWISKKNFNKNCVTRMSNKAITESMTPVKEFQEVLISDLEPMWSL